MSGMFRVGIVTSTHGVKGAVKIYPTTDDPQRFLKLKKVFFGKTDREEDAQRCLEIEKIQFFKNLVILKAKEIGTMEEAELLKGGSLWIAESDAAVLKENEYFVRDFLDAEVIDEEDHLLGTVYDVLETKSNDVLDIEETGGKHFLLPVIKECILQVDTVNRKVRVHVLEGLRE